MVKATIKKVEEIAKKEIVMLDEKLTIKAYNLTMSDGQIIRSFRTFTDKREKMALKRLVKINQRIVKLQDEAAKIKKSL